MTQEDLRTQIVDAALRSLEEKGPKGFGQVRVAREAGVKQGHLTYYFPKKTDLVIAVLQRMTEKTRDELAGLMSTVAQGTAADRKGVLFQLIKKMVRDKKRTRIVLGLTAEAEDDPALLELISSNLKLQRAVVAATLGRPPGDVDVELALAALRGLGIENILERKDERHTDALVDRLAHWLAPRD